MPTLQPLDNYRVHTTPAYRPWPRHICPARRAVTQPGLKNQLRWLRRWQKVCLTQDILVITRAGQPVAGDADKRRRDHCHIIHTAPKRLHSSPDMS